MSKGTPKERLRSLSDEKHFIGRYPTKVIQTEEICSKVHKFRTKANVLHMEEYEPKRFRVLKSELNKHPGVKKELIFKILEVGEDFTKRL